MRVSATPSGSRFVGTLRTPDGGQTMTRRRLVIAGIAVGMALVASGVGWLLLQPTFALDAAERDLRRHDIAAARVALGRFLESSPNDRRALLLAAQAARRGGAHGEAERLLGRAEAAGATEASGQEWMLLGVQQGDFAEVESRLRAAVEQKTADVNTLEALAKGYDAMYRWPEATLVLDQLIQRSPDHVPALVLRGTIHQRLRQTEAAEQDFREAVKRAPKSAAAHAGLGQLLCALGRTTDAIHHFETALRIDADNASALLGLARALLDAADFDKARQRLDQLLAKEPEHVDALLERGRLSLRQNRAAEAEEFLLKAAKHGPARRDVHQALLAAQRSVQKSAEASRSQARLTELEEQEAVAGRLKLRALAGPDAVKARWELWEWSVRNGHTEEGLAWLSEILRVAPRHGQAHQALAGYFDRAGQPRRAGIHRGIAAIR